MAEDEVLIGVKVESAQANAAINGFGKTVEQTNQKIQQSSNSIQKSTGGMFQNLSTGAGKFKGALSAIGLNPATIGFAALGTTLISAVKAFGESEAILARTQSVLESTGKIATISAGEVSALSESLSDLTGVEDEAIQSGANLLLQFSRIGKDELPKATKAAIDLAAAMNNGQATTEGIAASSRLLGKSLQDPQKGLALLTKQGISFTESEKEQIKQLTESGHVVEAQALLYKGLERATGGAAEAYRNTLPGALDASKTAFGNLLEVIGSVIAPLITRLAERVVFLAKALGVILKPLAQVIIALFNFGDIIRGVIFKLISMLPIFKIFSAAFRKVFEVLSNSKQIIDSLKISIIDFAISTVTSFQNIIRAIQPFVGAMETAINAVRTLTKQPPIDIKFDDNLIAGTDALIAKLQSLKNTSNDIKAQKGLTPESDEFIKGAENDIKAQEQKLIKFKEIKQKEVLEEQAALDLRRSIITADNEKRLQDEANFELVRDQLQLQRDTLKAQNDLVKTEASAAQLTLAETALTEHEQRKTDIQQAADIARIETGQATAETILNNLTSFDKRFTKINKAFQFGVAMRNAFVAISNALAQVPYPANLVAAAGIGIQAIANAKQILGFNKGGIVPGSGNTDSVPAMLTPGELVVPQNITSKLMSGNMDALQGFSGGGNGNTVNINNQNNFTERADIEFANRRLDRQLARSLK